MHLSLNDLSLSGQFHDVAAFRVSLECVMQLRQRAMQYGFPVFCNRAIASAPITATMILPQAVQLLSADVRRQLLFWLQQNGPFWDDNPGHSPEDLFECDDQVLTESAIAEAASDRISGIDHRLISFSPSAWTYSPIPVNFHPVGRSVEVIELENYFDSGTLENALQVAPNPIAGWADLEERCRIRFTNLTISPDAFDPLMRTPFLPAASERIMVLLGILHRLKDCFDSDGERTPEGHEIYQNCFTGDNALFSDSSDDEKRKHKKDMTFSNPLVNGQEIFCTMHGKIKTSQLRIHFSSPISSSEPLIVAYIGPKLTKT